MTRVTRKRAMAEGKSVFELYRLPFFDRRSEFRFWNVKPSGEYADDCETGEAYAEQFLASCDGTVGWSAILGWIVADMIRAADRSNRFSDGTLATNGIVVGFMRVIGTTLCVQAADRPEDDTAQASKNFH